MYHVTVLIVVGLYTLSTLGTFTELGSKEPTAGVKQTLKARPGHRNNMKNRPHMCILYFKNCGSFT